MPEPTEEANQDVKLLQTIIDTLGVDETITRDALQALLRFHEIGIIAGQPGNRDWLVLAEKVLSSTIADYPPDPEERFTNQ